MKTFFSKLYLFSRDFIQITSLLLTAFLFLGGFLFTCRAENMETQEVLTVIDNPFLGVLGILLSAVLLCACCRPVCRNAAKYKPVLLFLVLGWVMTLGGALILFGKTVPAADAMSVYSAAESLAKGDTTVIHPTDSYLSYYPQQVGLLAFFEICIRFWHLLPVDLPAYHFIKCIYVLLTCAIIYFQYATVRLLWEDDRADCIYLILAGANLPLIMYSSFVYGEIPSFAALSAGIFCLLKMLKKPRKPEIPSRTAFPAKYAIASLCALTLSVMLRKNSLILIIAVLLVTFLEWCGSRRHFLLLYVLLCAVLALNILPATQKYYERRAQNHLQSGVPPMSYFAMGMQESSRGNGWYNGFNFNTYQDTGMDREATEEISRQAAADRLAYFREHPGYAVRFYLGKHLSQWADGTYASRQATLATFGGRRPFFQSLYEGEYSRFYNAYCNTLQNMVYLGCLLFFLSGMSRHKRAPLYLYLGIIGVLGGFLFHIIWEANSRYIFPYSLLLMPYAAKGISAVSSTFSPERFRGNSTGRRSDATEKRPTAGRAEGDASSGPLP